MNEEMRIKLTKSLEVGDRIIPQFTNEYATDAAFLKSPWWEPMDQTAQQSAYSFELEATR